MRVRSGAARQVEWTQQADAGQEAQEPQAQGWGASDISRARIMLRLSAQALDDLSECARAVHAAGKPMAALTRADFSSPALDFEMQEARRRLRLRGGLVLLKGVCVNDFGLPDAQKIFLGLGLHMGRALGVGPGAEMLAADDAARVGSDVRGRVALRTDAADTLGLFCVRRAIVGGETVVASALRVHAILRARHPDALQILERGFLRVPVFTRTQGRVRCNYSRDAIERAGGDSLSAPQREALDCMDAIAHSAEVRVQFQLEPGEVLWLNACEVLHGSMPYEDHFDPGRNRLVQQLLLHD